MPYAAPTVCVHCQQARCRCARRTKDNRPTAAKRGYDSRWQAARLAYLRTHRRCVECNDAATVVDHVTPHRGNKRLFWARSNWQPMCKRCHDMKTGKGQ